MQPCKFYSVVASGRKVKQKLDKITWMSGEWGWGTHARTAREGERI